MKAEGARRWVPIGLAVGGLALLVGVFAWVTLRSDNPVSEPVRDELRSEIRAEIVTAVSDLLQISEAEALELYEDGKLGQAAAERGIDEQEIFQVAEEAMADPLSAALERGDISSEQAQEARRLVRRALGKRI